MERYKCLTEIRRQSRTKSLGCRTVAPEQKHSTSTTHHVSGPLEPCVLRHKIWVPTSAWHEYSRGWNDTAMGCSADRFAAAILLKESWNATQKTPLDSPNLLHSYVNNKCSWSILSIHVHKILEKFVLICTFLHENIDKILVVGTKGSRRSAHHLLHSVKVSQTCRWEKQNEKCRRTRGIEEGADYSHSDVLLTFISLLLWNLSLFPDEINYPIFKL